MQLGSLTEENNELKKDIKMQRDLYEERLVDAKKKASDEYFQMQEDLQVIREELEASEQQSKTALDELRQ